MKYTLSGPNLYDKIAMSANRIIYFSRLRIDSLMAVIGTVGAYIVSP